MTPRSTLSRWVATAALAALAACGGAAAQVSPSGAPVAAPGPAYPHTPADVRFMSAMIGHHAQAVEMARLAPTHGASASVRTLAERIINAQQDEIATMRQWLGDRGEPVPDSAAGAHAGHAMHGPTMHGPAMPGMLTGEQLRQLGQARGAEFDRLFLRLMIQHHGGAVAMVKELFGTPGAGQDPTVFKFASDVQVDQSTEIARMQRMLAALILGGGAP